jgi:uncharacterized protein (DUF1501 family)
MNRRTLLQLGATGALSSLTTTLLSRRALALKPAAPPPKVTQLIVLWMNGGPSHIDTWDPKSGVTGGKHKAIATKIPNVTIAEHMPRLAAMANKLCIVRSLTTKEGNHQRAQYLLHTGYSPNPTIAHPSIGGWISQAHGDADSGDATASGLPGFVSLGGPSHSAGFLGAQYNPYVIPKGGKEPENLAYADAVSAERFARREALLKDMDHGFFEQTGDAKVVGRQKVYEKAIRMMRAPDVEAFDLSKEPEAVRTAFGDTEFGRNCLTALRLASAGVRVTEVTLDGWDTHQDNFTRTQKQMEILDPAMSALLSELERRKHRKTSASLLSSTAVVWMGDFGRTPKINGNDGRDHYPGASSCVLAGAGIRTGQVVGATDPTGGKVVSDPVTPANLMATLCALMGLDPAAEQITPIGRPIAVTDHGVPVAKLLL